MPGMVLPVGYPNTQVPGSTPHVPVRAADKVVKSEPEVVNPPVAPVDETSEADKEKLAELEAEAAVLQAKISAETVSGEPPTVVAEPAK